MLCLIGRFIFCLLHTAAAGLAGWVVLILHLAFDNLLFIVFAWWWELYYVFLFTLHIFVLFVSIQFDLLFVMFSLNSGIFFCSAKSTFIHLLELHVWFGFLLLIIIIYHKYVRQYVTGIESQDKLWTEEEIRNDMSSGLPTVFFIYFSKNVDWVNFFYFFLSIITFNYVTWETDFHQTFSRASVNNEINWKLEGTNRKWHAKPTNYFFIKDKFLNFFFVSLLFLIIWLQTLYLFCWRRPFFFFSSREPFMESSNNCTCSRLTRSMW